MKLDMDLVRQILMKIEASTEADGVREVTLDIDDRPEEVAYCLQILVEGGFINARVATTLSGGRTFYPKGLTLQGHQFLEQIRDDTRWGRFKRGAKGLTLKTLEAAVLQGADAALSAISGVIK